MEHIDWDDLRILVAIARGGTMRSAAAACDLSAPTLSRRLSELEQRLGEPLIDRVPSGCTVTAFGARVLAWAEQMEELAHQIERAADVNGGGGPHGTVRINAAEWPSYILLKLLGSFQERLPGLAIEVLTSQRPYSLARREADIALWSECPDEGDLYVRRIGKIRFGLFSSRDYYLRHKTAITRKEWDKLSFVGYDDRRADHPATQWLKTLPGAPVPTLRSSYGTGVFDGVMGGSGLGVLAQLAGDTTSELVCLERHIKTLDQDVWMVLHPALRDSERIRTVANLLADIFR
ncbi:LysR family transcriptional regulator [Paraburkholderia sp. DHOC27]|uniref:LysR family transcriptional regulator n=1 Tax=Paraburkholderia sp. DHOC27 TaxID=2303330 RepID=UPI000E3E0906|nr:LysR family transcriptional regulator [Paraburkholderia sp. DHOC27]RFU48557.1 LysR family transcriptional regulator [Paraburkholderia sp. DHOC27]